MQIMIANNGVDIVQTNYWSTDLGLRGMCYLTANAGALRLLVPPAAESMLVEMRTGTHVVIEPSIFTPGQVDVVFEDGTDAPFSLTIDPGMVDRKLDSRSCRLTVWTQAGKQLDLPCETRF